jgi:hypothetical protein
MWASLSSTGPVAQGQYAFASLPPGIKEITLVLPHLPVSLDDPVYQNWEIPLHLQPASKDGRVSSSGAAGWSTQPIQGITLRLENVLAESDRTVLQLALIPENPQWQVWEWGTLQMEDQDGKIYPLIEQPHSLQPITSRIFQTEAIDPSKHLTITLEGVKIRNLSPEVLPQSTVAPTIQLDGQWQISWHLE